MTDDLAGFDPRHAGLLAMTPTSLALSFFVVALIASIVSSIWVRPDVSLGRPYWILTLVLTLPTLLLGLISAVDSRDVLPITAVLLIFGPVAAGWLLGSMATLLVRAVRARGGAPSKS
jgi:hypothetical protein